MVQQLNHVRVYTYLCGSLDISLMVARWLPPHQSSCLCSRKKEKTKVFRTPDPISNSADFCLGLFSRHWGMRPPLAGKVGNRTVESGFDQLRSMQSIWTQRLPGYVYLSLLQMSLLLCLGDDVWSCRLLGFYSIPVFAGPLCLLGSK